MNRKLYWLGIGVAAAFLARRFFFSLAEAQTTSGLLPDVAGNYDIDGVSYDTKRHEVVVSGDATHGQAP